MTEQTKCDPYGCGTYSGNTGCCLAQWNGAAWGWIACDPIAPHTCPDLPPSTQPGNYVGDTRCIACVLPRQRRPR